MSPGEQHLGARRCITENTESGSRGMNRLVSLQCHQAVFGDFRETRKGSTKSTTIHHSSSIALKHILNIQTQNRTPLTWFPPLKLDYLKTSNDHEWLPLDLLS